MNSLISMRPGFDRDVLAGLLVLLTAAAGCSGGGANEDTDASDLTEDPSAEETLPETQDGPGDDAATEEEAADAEDDSESADAPDESDGPDAPDPRDELRERTLFLNTSFESKNPDDTPAHWSCVCFGPVIPDVPCFVREADDARHGERVLVLPSECAAYQDTSSFDPTRSVQFDLFASPAPSSPADAFYMFGFVNDGMSGMLAAGEAVDDGGGWAFIASDGEMSTTIHDRLRMVFYNGSPGELLVDDFIAVQLLDNPDGALLRAEHHTELRYGSGTEAGLIWVPLPLRHATQVPLYVELTVTPEAVIDDVTYVTHEAGNWGAEIRFAPDAPATDVVVAWTAVVLTRHIEHGERPTMYGATDDPATWTAATPVADAGYTGIVETCSAISTPADPPQDRMQAVIGWTSENISSGFSTSLDATAVFESRLASCTGYANLASAMGRALAVPTRTLACFMTGMSQQTHSINEFFLGETLGWRRVEPQSSAPLLSEDYVVALRLILPGDEADEAITDVTRWAAPGVPLYSVVEPLVGHGRMTPDYSPDYFPDCAACDNRAEIGARLFDAAASVSETFDRAVILWQADIAQYLAGELDAGRMDTRRLALSATDLDDVIAILDALE